MYISRIVIRNYRNFALLDTPIKEGVTCIIGENNTGKTNFLHAIRLVIDSNLSSIFRQLTEHDLHASADFTKPSEVIISLEIAGFKGKTNEEALVGSWSIEEDKARITFRFRPEREIRDAIIAKEHDGKNLTLEDYRWEICTGDGSKDPARITWKEDTGKSVRFADLQSFQVVMLPAIRDVQNDLRQRQVSPLGKILDAAEIPESEKQSLMSILKTANTEISKTPTIKNAGQAIDKAYKSTASEAFKMDIRLGMADPSFASISRSLTVLLSTEAVKDFDPSRNGLGINNILYFGMLLEYFDRRIEKHKSAGQLLLIEEPEAHLHPQLQRVLHATLRSKSVQTLLTTHSTYISSQAPFESYLVLTNDGSHSTKSSSLAGDIGLTQTSVADLERFLDATRSSLLFARKVILVEGPAELFLIPALVKAVKKVDLDQRGITVVPIHGTHFDVYAKLFSSKGMPKKCAIITDGDLVPSDANPKSEAEDEGPSPPDLSKLENRFVKVFQCKTTFERELTRRGLLSLLKATADDFEAVRLKSALSDAIKTLNKNEMKADDENDLLQKLGTKVLNSAKRFGKARFAQVAARHAEKATALPSYIDDAIKWILEP